MSACRSCGAEILWVWTERDSRMPLDAQPYTGTSNQGLFVLRDVGNAEPTALAAWGLEGTEPHYTCHFATCPQADDWRKKRATA